MKQDPEYMPDRWHRIVQRIVRGEEWGAAAKAEGCSTSYAEVIKTRMMKHPAVVKAIESIRTDARREAVYGVVEAMAQAQKGIDLAERHHNPMAFIKGCELRAKLSGLLVERVEVVSVDLTGALERAKARVLPLLTASSHAAPAIPEIDPAVQGGIFYGGPGTRSNPFGD